MSKKQDRKTIYRECRERTGLNDVQWARLMGVGSAAGVREVHKKERAEEMASSRGVSMPEALAAQLLLFLHEEGYNLLDIGFDASGRMAGRPSRRKKAKE